MLYATIISLLFFIENFAIAIDTAFAVKLCKNITIKRYIHSIENEGIWYPQYRSDDYNNKFYTCHVMFEEVNFQEPVTLTQKSYYRVLGKPAKIPYSIVWEIGSSWEEYSAFDFLPGKGGVEIIMKLINITPDYRIRYICTNERKNNDGKQDIVFVDTRSAHPDITIINEVIRDLSKSGLGHLLLKKIKQDKCKRPITKPSKETF